MIKIVFFIITSICFIIFLYKTFPLAFPTINIPITEDRNFIKSESTKLFHTYSLCPFNKNKNNNIEKNENDSYDSSISDKELRSTNIFHINSLEQNYIELSSGSESGRNIFHEMIEKKIFNFYEWKSRFYEENEKCETWLFFTSNLEKPIGFMNILKEDEMYNVNNYERNEIEKIIEKKVQEKELFFDELLNKYEFASYSKEIEIGGRVDHEFVYELKNFTMKDEGKIELHIVFAGDQLKSIYERMKVPEKWIKSYELMRSFNDFLAYIASFMFSIIAGFILIFGLIYLIKKKYILYKSGVICGIGLGVLEGFLLSVNKIPESWIGYQTNISEDQFLLTIIINSIMSTIFMAIFFSVVFIVGESFSRKVFHNHVMLWKYFNVMNTKEIIYQFFLSYWIVLFMLSFGTGFYYIANNYFDWWIPTSVLLEPNHFSHYFPWYSSVVMSLGAGVIEEFAFRALILAFFWFLSKQTKKVYYKGIFKILGFTIMVFVFSAAHANYPTKPFYARLVELIVPSSIFGFLYIKYGLVIPIFVHYLYDLFWFGLSIWVSQSEYVLLYRIILVFFAFVPFVFILIAIILKGKIAENVEKYNNSKYKPSKKITKKKYSVKKRYGRNISNTFVLLFLCTALSVLWYFFIYEKVEKEKYPLISDRQSVRNIAEKVFRSTTNRSLTSNMDYYFTVTSGIHKFPLSHHYVLEKFNDEYDDLIKNKYIYPVYYHCKFIEFQNIEEYHYYIYKGKIQKIVHLLPEDRPGKNLTEEEARSLAISTLDQNGFPTDLKELVSQSFKRPQRMDWYFDFNITELRRVEVVLTGEIVNLFNTHVYVPEKWSRDRESEKFNVKLVHKILSKLPMMLSFLIFFIAILSWTKNQLSRKVFSRSVPIFAAIVFLKIFMNFDDVLFSFAPSKSFKNQLYTSLLLTFFTTCVVSVYIGLVSGMVVHWKNKSTVKHSKNSFIIGLLRSLIDQFTNSKVLIGFLIFVNAKFNLFELKYTKVPDYDEEGLKFVSSFIPLLAITLYMSLNFFKSSFMSLFYVLWISDASPFLGCLLRAFVSSIPLLVQIDGSYYKFWIFTILVRFLIQFPLYHVFEKHDLSHIKYRVWFNSIFYLILDVYLSGVFAYPYYYYVVVLVIYVLFLFFYNMVVEVKEDVEKEKDE